MSFNGNKIITTSGGGALVTNSKAVKDKAVFLSTQARDNAPHYQHSEIGYNYRMSNIVAGIGRGQMTILDNHVKQRRLNHMFYMNAFDGIEEIRFLEEPSQMYSNRWLTTIQLPSYSIREGLREFLLKDNIESRPLWKPMHLQPVFKDSPEFINGI